MRCSEDREGFRFEIVLFTFFEALMSHESSCDGLGSAYKISLFCASISGRTFDMLASRWKVARRIVNCNRSEKKAHAPTNGAYSFAIARRYSTVRRRVVKPESDLASKLYSTEDPASIEKRKKELDREFDETFFRKPKVLIIGTDATAMTTGMSTILIFLRHSSLLLFRICCTN